jgi:hypothetical protein
MKYAWQTLKPRERRAIAGAGVLIGSWLAVVWLIQPLWEQMRELQGRIARSQQRLEAISRLFAQAPEITRRYQLLASSLSPDGQAGQQPQTLLETVQATCSQLNLQPSLKPRVAKSAQGGEERLEVDLGVEGPQGQVFALLDALMRLPRLMTIQELRILSVASRTDTLRATIILQDGTPRSSR